MLPNPGSGTEALRYRQVAAALMRMALALLDRSDDCTLAAARLQRALDTLVPPTTTLRLPHGERPEDRSSS